MSETWRNLSTNLASFIAPGLVLLLLGIQVAFGLRGFDKPDDSLLYVLQVPGALLGWGGVAMLLPLLVWMILDWWGYDLNGFALKGLGSAVLGVAVGTLFGLSGGLAAGGLVGAGLASVLTQTVGPVVAWILLLLMAAPACVLAFSLQRGMRPTTAESASSTDAPTSQVPRTKASGSVVPESGGARSRTAGPPSPEHTSGSEGPGRAAGSGVGEDGHRKPRYPTGGILKSVFGRLTGRGSPPEEDSAWYPLPRFDRHGNELPMDFGRSRDVGGIRFADEGEADTTDADATDAADKEPTRAAEDQDAAKSNTAAEERLPTIPELLAGNFHGGERLGQGRGTRDVSGGPRELLEDLPDDGPIHVDGRGRPLPPSPGAAPAANSQPAPDESDAGKQAPADEARTFIASHLPGAPARTSPADALQSSPVGSTPKPPEPALAPGVRYADESETKERESSPRDAGRAPRTGTLDKDKAKDEEGTVEDRLSQAVRDAVRGPVASSNDSIGQQSARTIRKTLRQSVAALQTDGNSDRHLAKLEAMGLFDSFEGPGDADGRDEASEGSAPQSSAPKSSATKSSAQKDDAKGRDVSPGTSAAGAAAATLKAAKPKKAAAKKRKKTAAKKATPKKKKAAAKKTASKQGRTKKAASRKSPAARKTAADKTPGRSEEAQGNGRRGDVPGQLLFLDGADGDGSDPQARRASPAERLPSRGNTPARKRTVKDAVRERQSMLEGLRIERLDPLFRRTVEAVLERGTATPVLLTRTLGLPFARAQSLIERLISVGVLKEKTEAGSHPVAITRTEWENL